MIQSNKELEADARWFKDKRQKALDRLNKSIEPGNTFNTRNMEESWKSFLRVHKQWVLINDVLLSNKSITK